MEQSIVKNSKENNSKFKIIDNNLRFRWLGSTVLKIIAVISMYLDHIGFILFPQFIIFRELGRFALPIFAFLIVIGMHFTRNRNKYLLRLVIYLVVLQIPISIFLSFLTLSGISSGYVSIFFDLSAGAAFIVLYKYKKYLAFIFFIAISLFLILIEQPSINSVIFIDYGWYGFYLIIIFFFAFEWFYKYKSKQNFLFFKITSCILFLALTLIWIYTNLGLDLRFSGIAQFQIYSLSCIPIFLLYNDKKEKNGKIFRAFYYSSYPLSFLIPFSVAFFFF